ncbi:G-TYPE LECTIN S-RECEPTOR-LIKE SERINE/THREONINE-PROTEIN KINASE SD2-5 [Salix viminalis]|uniref:G-TYPE LECTIN S-RECEPTOR-LIKE SERINE/THREONINE-PROTEIN KINASE SD2-5 n=1 Tax=Salix viminalis TaxID=40686 RepID=A0A9Q0Z8D8_SALVM|nr:G-TYPE LECTIN S-RECEPTOR-LIKE SERINE/THREONINE-PROTEIN KINASE SD2-5 [Salix viminalis]
MSEVQLSMRGTHGYLAPEWHKALGHVTKKAEYILGYLDEYIRSDREEILRMLEVAAWCLQDDPERRPLMSTVVKVVEGVMEVDSNLVYKFSHALTPPPAVDAHISSAPPQASVLSNPR